MPAISKSSRYGFIRKIQYENKKTDREKLLSSIEDTLTVKANEYRAEKCRRDFSYFIDYFWPDISSDTLIWNWHISFLAGELMSLANDVANGIPRKHDLLINIPPGTTKSITTSIMFPVWCWINWPWMKFIAASYSGALALEHAETSRELVRSERFKELFPHLSIKADKDQKSNFRLVYNKNGISYSGGNRLSTSVGGTLTGFHGHILIVDDPLDPNRSVSEVELKNANRWIDQTLSTRKINKTVTPTILIMQRLHQNDPTGHILSKKKLNTKHISLPGEIRDHRDQLKPEHLASNYVDDLLDPNRMNWNVLQDMKADLGQYGYAGQIGQSPIPPAGGMFHVDHFQTVRMSEILDVDIKTIVRYWDKAGTKDGGAYTTGVKMAKLANGKFVVLDVRRGQWASHEREAIIRQTAEADGVKTIIYHEQEPGSGGKDSALATTSNLSGFSAYADRPTGDKVYRADPYSVQVNNGNVLLVSAEWNQAFIEEHRFFPFGTYKDQVDASSGAFNKLNLGKKGWVL